MFARGFCPKPELSEDKFFFSAIGSDPFIACSIRHQLQHRLTAWYLGQGVFCVEAKGPRPPGTSPHPRDHSTSAPRLLPVFASMSGAAVTRTLRIETLTCLRRVQAERAVGGRERRIAGAIYGAAPGPRCGSPHANRV